MLKLRLLSLFFLIWNFIYCAPVYNSKQNDESDLDFEKLLHSIDYGTYLSQVMDELQNDEEFSKKIHHANNSESVSDALNIVSPHIRSKLDELKRLEILRLNKLQREVDRRKSEGYHPHEMPLPPIKSIDISHLDDLKPESFNPEDLKRLIDRTTEIFTKIDKKNDENYKVHEMEKEAKKRLELEKTIADERLRMEAEVKWLKEERKKRAQHKLINEPASIEQLKTVWKIDDHMNEDSFNPRTFFYMHDVNSDGNLDVAELETLLQRELDKAYDLNDNTTDLVERYHEMTRMRKKFLKHVDLDQNHLISLEEFIKWAKSDQANEGKEWKIQEEIEPNYSSEEFETFYKDYMNRHPELHQPSAPVETTPIPQTNPPTK